MTQPQIPVEDIGGCPYCRGGDQVVVVDGQYYAICQAHQVYWWVSRPVYKVHMKSAQMQPPIIAEDISHLAKVDPWLPDARRRVAWQVSFYVELPPEMDAQTERDIYGTLLNVIGTAAGNSPELMEAVVMNQVIMLGFEWTRREGTEESKWDEAT